jgi:hypothetical protein
MSTSKKRSSPGADTAKNGDPFADVSIGPAEESVLSEFQKNIQRVELLLGEHFCDIGHATHPFLTGYFQSVVRRCT